MKRLSRIEKMVLLKHNAVCLANEMKNGAQLEIFHHCCVAENSSRKYFNQGMVKGSIPAFQCTSKNSCWGSLTCRKYLGGREKERDWSKNEMQEKEKSVPICKCKQRKPKMKEGEDPDKDNDDDNTNHQKVKGQAHTEAALKWTLTDMSHGNNLNATSHSYVPRDNQKQIHPSSAATMNSSHQVHRSPSWGTANVISPITSFIPSSVSSTGGTKWGLFMTTSQ